MEDRRTRGEWVWKPTLAAAAMVVACGMFPARGEGEKADPKVKPEIVAKVSEFFKKVDTARRPKMDERMAAEIQDIAKATGLGPEGVKALQAAAGPAEDAAQAEQWANQIKVKPAEFAAEGEASLRFLDQPSAVESMAETPETIAYTGPTEQPSWKAALARALTPEQATAWEKTQADRTAAIHKEIDSFLDGRIGQFRPQGAEGVTAYSHVVIAALDLPKARADALNALAEKAIDASMARWREKATKSLLNESVAQRAATLKSKNYYFPVDAADAPEKLPVWTEGIAKLLSDDERARMQARQSEQRTRSVHALAQLMVALLDEKLAFDRDQRTRLEPIADRLVQTNQGFFPSPGENQNYNAYGPQSFYQTTTQARPEEVRPILDGLQLHRWEALKDDKGGDAPSDDDDTPAATPAPAGQGADAPGEPEDLEQTVSDYLQTHTAKHRQESESTMILRAEDAARVAALSPATAARLQTAARGAAAAATRAWLSNIEEIVRSSVQGATRENLPGKLAGIGSYYFQQPTDPTMAGIWTATVNSELTAPQRAAWTAELAARTAYHDAAVAQFLAMQFDRTVGLSDAQWKGVLPLITKAFQDYEPDIGRMFTYNGNVPWYLSSYYSLLPLHGVPEDQFKALLSKDQWATWTGSTNFSNTSSYWDNIKQSHDSRVKQEEQQKKP